MKFPPSPLSPRDEDRCPFGAWVSPVTIDLMTPAAISLGGLTVDGDALYWLEARPSENGRTALCRRRAARDRRLDPGADNVGSRVHEYGGGAFGAEGVVSFQRTHRWQHLGDRARRPPRRIETPEGCRYADFEFDAARAACWPYAKTIGVARRPTPSRDCRPAARPWRPGETVLVKGPDFLSSPRIPPDGENSLDRLGPSRYALGRHPALRRRGEGQGRAESGGLVAGAAPEAIVQPEWAARSLFLFGPDGWWNLYVREGDDDWAPVEKPRSAAPTGFSASAIMPFSGWTHCRLIVQGGRAARS